METEEDQVEPSRETCSEAIPEVASDPEGVTVNGDMNQPFEPFGAGMEKPAVGGVASILIVWELVPRFPAISWIENTTVWVPSPLTDAVLPDCAAPPSML